MKKFHKKPHRSVPISDANGRIQRISLLVRMEKRLSPEVIATRFRNILTRFYEHNPEIKFTFIIKFDGDHPMRRNSRFRQKILTIFRNFVHENLQSDNEGMVDFIDFNSNFNSNFFQELTTKNYAQDLSINSMQNGQTVLNIPYSQKGDPRPGRTLPGTFEIKENVICRPTNMYFEGGNLISGGKDLLIVGKDTLIDNMERNMPNLIELSRSERLQVLNHLYEKEGKKVWVKKIKSVFDVQEVIVAGSDEPIYSAKSQAGKYYKNYSQGSFQAAYHLDYYLTLGGTVIENGKQKHLVFIGQLKDGQQWNLVNPYTAPVNYDCLESISNDLDRLAWQFESKQVNGTGFQVVRVPYPIDIAIGKPIPFCNAIVESISRSNKTIFIPGYAEDESSPYFPFQEKAAEAFANAGLKVIPVPGFAGRSIGSGGSLHCMVKVMERG